MLRRRYTSQLRLNGANGGTEHAGRQETWPERARRVLAERGQARERHPDSGAHLLDLPANFVIESTWRARRGQTGGLGGVCGRA